MRPTPIVLENSTKGKKGGYLVSQVPFNRTGKDHKSCKPSSDVIKKKVGGRPSVTNPQSAVASLLLRLRPGLVSLREHARLVAASLILDMTSPCTSAA